MIKLLGPLILPFVHKVAATLTIKNIPFEHQDVDLANRPEWFKQSIPFGKAPSVILDNNEVIGESSIICNYLEENYTTGIKLYPDDIMNKLKTQYIAETANNSLREFINLVYYAKHLDSMEIAKTRFKRTMIGIDKLMEGDKYFYKSGISMIDVTYGVVFTRMHEIEQLTGEKLFSQYPKLLTWSENLLEQPWLINTLPKNYKEIIKTTYNTTLENITKKP